MIKILPVLFATVLIFVTLPATATNSYSDDYVEAEGVVYPEGQSLNAMRRIAIMDAYRYLSERIDTIYVSSNSTVKNLRDLDDAINAKVETALRGATVVSVNRESDGSFHAIVRLYKHGSPNSLASAVLREDVRVEDFPAPKFTNIVSASYTGLIIDCRGKNLSEAIAPAIKSVDGTEIYAYRNLGYQTTISMGMIGYSTSMDSGVERAGSLPLVIKAVSISSECDVVVNADDADKILTANQSTHFLNNCAVVFVR